MNGRVNLSDFNVLAANFGITAGAGGPTPSDWSALSSAVPEPGSAALLAATGHTSTEASACGRAILN